MNIVFHSEINLHKMLHTGPLTLMLRLRSHTFLKWAEIWHSSSVHRALNISNHVHKAHQGNRYNSFELKQRIKWAVPRCQCLMGPISSQWGCSGEGKQRLSQGICHLTWLLCSVCYGLEKESKTVATPQALFQNTFHSLSDYGARLGEVDGALLKNQGSVAPRGLRA